mgnify:FL=1
MKVCNVDVNNRIDCRKASLISENGKFFLLYFKSDAFLTSNGEKCKITGKSVVICNGKLEFRTPEIQLGGYVVFEADIKDFQFFSDLGIEFNKAIPVADEYMMSTLFHCLSLEYRKTGKFKCELENQLLRLIIIKVAEMSSAQEEYQEMRKHYEFLSDIREQIYNSPFEKIEIDDICNELGVGRTYFHRIYNAYFGTSYLQDIINSKLENAKKMLVATDNSISVIAEKCGYESDSYFMRQFKKHTGFTPSVYRKKYSEI